MAEPPDDLTMQFEVIRRLEGHQEMQYQAPAAGSTLVAAAAVTGSLPITGSSTGVLVGMAVACLAVGSVTMRAAAAMRSDQK